MRKINLKDARSQLEELKRLQGKKDTISNVVVLIESSGQISATLYRGLPKSGKLITKTFPSLRDLLEFPGITDETGLLLDDMALAPDMYLPADLILWFCPPEEVRAFIRFNQEGNQNEWLKRYIDLIQCLQKEGFRLPDDPALNDLMENHSRFSLEELVERYQDRRWFVPYEPNR